MATVITDVTELQAMENDLTADYELGNNIGASATATWNEDPGNPGTYFGFDPIIDFTGSFDGKGYTINDLYIDRPTETNVGLFGSTDNGCGTIQNVGLVDCDITGKHLVGALIGYQQDIGGAVNDCYSSGSVSSGDSSLGGYIGGLIGSSFGTLTDCYSTCTATNTGGAEDALAVGGLVGALARSALRCFATGAVTATSDGDIQSVGGLVGVHSGYDVNIEKCYSTGNVSVTAGARAKEIGGLVGDDLEGILNCYSRGSVTVSVGNTAWGGVGGFIGAIYTDAIDNSYSTGLVTITIGIPNTGGFCGYSTGVISNCFWDTQTSGYVTSDGGTGKTTAQMKTESTFTDAGWDFDTIWDINAVQNNGYPFISGVSGDAPTVTTQAVSSIAGTTATGNGNITDLGSPNPTAHGVCYNTTGSPTVSDSTTDEGAAVATGAFTSNMTGLSINTKYYVKAYAANTGGISYGSEVNFTTLGVPTITTQTCESVVGATATGRGEITVIGNPTPTAHGHCWNTTVDPTTSPNSVDNGAASVIGTFISSITGLTPGTGYYTRAYATNTQGTVYGANVYFVAPTTGTTGRAGYTWDESSNLRSFDENALERQYIHTDDVDDTPANGATTAPISSNWAYDHVAAADPHTGYVLESLFDAHTVLYSISDNTPAALTVTEQTLVGRLTSGNIAAIALGIADNNIVQIDHVSVADDDYAKFTTVGLEGRSYSEVASDIQSSIDHGSIAGLTDDDHNHYLLRSFMNGSFKEKFNATVASSGGVVTMSIEKAGGGDLTMQFSSGITTLDCTPADTIALTAGSDTSPQANWIYVLESSQVLTKSTTTWPTAEHIRVGFFFCQSAVSMATAGGPIINQNFNDFLEDPNSMGHLLHITDKLRLLDATYFSGVDGNGTTGYLTITAGNVEFKSTAGVIFQLHKHTFPAFDTSGTDTMHVKNWSGDAYHALTNLHDIVADSGGNSIGNNKWFNMVMWGVQNKDGEHQTVMINLPSGFYNTQADAEHDVSGYDDFTMPREFSVDSSVGFLIARITVKMASTWVYGSAVDLRGTNPQTASGGASGIATSFADNAFDVFDEADTTKVLAFDIGTNVTTGNTRTVQIPDANGIMAYTSQTNGTIDHGADLAGLGDDDHTQYFLLAGETTNAQLYSGADFIVYSDAGSTEEMRIDGATGHIGIAFAPSTRAGFLNYETYLIGDNAVRGGTDTYISAYKTSAAYTSSLFGLYFGGEITSSNTQNWTNTLGIRGVWCQIVLGTGTASASTITGAAAIYVETPSIGSSANDMVLTNYYGLYIDPITLIGNSKLTNNYGIYIGNQAGGATLNYAIYTNAGLVRFGGAVTLASTLTDGTATLSSGAWTGATYSGLTITTTTGTFTLASGKTFTVSNTLTLTATDTATLAIGSGGTLGSAAYTASTDYVAKSTFDAHTILIAVSDDTPIKLDVAASRVVGRKSSGNIVAMTGAETGALIKLDELATPTDVTTLNSSTSAHGLLKKLDNVATNFMNGQGNWSAPAGAGATSRVFSVNAFQYPAPATEWIPTTYGAYLPTGLSSKKCWLSLNFLKQGDIITSYKLVGDATLGLGTAEDFSTYTEEDDNNKLTVTAPKALAADVDRDEDVWIVKDYTADYFDGFDIDFELFANSSSDINAYVHMGIANTIGSVTDFADTDIAFGFNTGNYMRLIRGNVVAVDEWVGYSDDTLYYCTMTRPAGGDSVTVRIYDDSGRTSLKDTLVVAGYSTTKYRYAYGFVNRNTGTADRDFDGYIQNMYIKGVTLDCKLVQVNKADPLTTTDITNGAMTQVIADGNFDVAVDCDDTTVATDKQYLLEIEGSAGNGVYVIGAEVTITRL